MHRTMLKDFIRNDELELLLLDPSYLMLGDEGDSASNLFKMGRVLAGVSSIIAETGCSIILCHHHRKNRPQNQKRHEPPDLAELTQSGAAEWARFWLLLGTREEWDEHAGSHKLWMRAGGSAGHSGLWCVDAREGRRSDPGGRVWEVAVTSASDSRKDEQGDAEQRAAEKRERIEDEQRAKLVEVMQRYPLGETKTTLKSESGLKPEPFATALHTLRQQGRIEDCQIKKNHRTEDAMRYIATPGARSVPVGTAQD